jgi:hypothetical protein
MLVVRARNELQTSLGRAVPAVLLFQHPTPAALATALSQSGDGRDGTLERSAEERAAQRHNADRQQAERRRAARRLEQ